MKPQVIFAKVSDLFKYLKTRRRRKLYEQWVKEAELPPETVPRDEFAEDIIPKIDKKKLPLPMLYMVLGASLVVLCIGIILVAMRSC